MFDNLKTELKTLAEAQNLFETRGWTKTESIQKDPLSNSTAYGTVYEKNDKKFYLNIHSATKAIQFINKTI
jgi:hypothetical protein